MNPNTDRLDSSFKPHWGNEAPVQEENGLLEGAIVLTADGALPVEYLQPGDRVISRNSGMVKLVEVTVTEIVRAPLAVCADALGKNRPEGDILLAGDVEINLRDWRAKALFGETELTVRADRLADGEHIRKLSPVRWRMFSLKFERDEVIYADGLEVLAPAA